ncbi:hypothetical protein ACXEG6_005322, partial [Klebsiella pneumoniae]
GVPAPGWLLMPQPEQRSEERVSRVPFSCFPLGYHMIKNATITTIIASNEMMVMKSRGCTT